MNTNGFYALCFEEDGYAQIPWEGITENKFSICVKCLTKSSDECGTIFSLGSLLSVGISNGRISYSSQTTSRICDEKIPLHCKNTITLVYDGTEMLLYCNSFCVAKENVTLNSAEAKFIRIGEGLTESYIYKVMIFNRCLSEKDVISMLAGKATDFYKQIDFTSPTEKTNAELNNCRIENLVYTLDCSNGTLTVPQIRFPEKFTLLFSFFAINNGLVGGVIFKTPNISIELCYSFNMSMPTIKVTCFDGVGNSVKGVKVNCWTNAAAIFDNGEISIYYNDEVQLRCTRDMTRETGEIQFGRFSGYINSCYVVNGALSVDQIQNLFRNSPNVFDKNTLHLYNFAEDLLQVADKGFLFNGAKLALVKGTGAEAVEKKIINGPDSNRKYSEFAQWQIELLINLLVNWLYHLLGVYPNKGVHRRLNGGLDIDKGLYEFVYREIASMKEAQILLCHYDNLKPEDLYNLIKAMEKNGTLKKLLDYLYQDDENQEPISVLLLAILAAALLAALSSSLSKAAALSVSKPPKRTDDNDDDDDDDDDDKKKKKTYISIKQASLKSELKTESDKKDLDNQTAVAVFAKSETSKASLEVVLSYKGDDAEFTVHVENHKQGGMILNAEKTVSFCGKNPVKINLDVQLDKFERKYGKCTEELRWKCESSDNEQVRFLGETSVEIYFLEKSPCEPWGSSINIECLKLCAECSDNAGANSKGFVEDYAHFLENRIQTAVDDVQFSAGTGASKRKAYSKNPNLTGSAAVFDAVSFSRDFPAGKKISAIDITHSHVVLSRLNGYSDIKMAMVSHRFGIGTKLLLKNGCAIDPHFVVEDGNGRIYDFELKSFGLPFPETEKPNCPLTGEENSSYYRESNYLPGSCCDILYKTNNWVLGLIENDFRSNTSELDMPIVGSVIRNNEGKYVHQGRTPSDEYVIEHIRGNKKNSAMCHSISSKNIDCAVAEICNSNNSEARLKAEPLLNALYPNNGLSDEVACKYKRLTQHLSDTLIRSLHLKNDFLQHLICHFCFLAANSPENLRLGDSTWNSAVREEFDPESWFYYCADTNMCISSERGYDYNPFPIVAMHDRYGWDIPDPENSGFYLPNWADGIRIQNMLKFNISMKPSCREAIQYSDSGNPVVCPLIFSSSNRNSHGEAGDKYEKELINDGAVYYLDNNRWAEIH